MHMVFDTELTLPPCPLSANVSSVKPDRGDNHHSSAISTEIFGPGLNVRRCCVVSWRALVSPQMSGERGQ